MMVKELNEVEQTRRDSVVTFGLVSRSVLQR